MLPSPRTRLHPSLHHPALRECQEKHLHASNLVYPIFVTDRHEDVPIKGFSPNVQWGAGADRAFASLVRHLKGLERKGLRSVMIFGITESKDSMGSMAHHHSTPVITCLKALKKGCPKLMLMTDVCLCEYTDHGHCAPIKTIEEDGSVVVDNEMGVKRLSEVALAYVRAGAHMVCPSDMMDGRVGSIRRALAEAGMNHAAIMAYTSKKASCMYGPFRAAVESTFKGDRKRYQHPPGDERIARRALRRDVDEGADVVLVKPSLFYGDIISHYAKHSDVPVAAYVVSGEYKMLKDYGEATGCLENVLKESHVGLIRAGASIIVTYFTPALLDLIPNWA